MRLLARRKRNEEGNDPGHPGRDGNLAEREGGK
jgi:hypothetical protein